MINIKIVLLSFLYLFGCVYLQKYYDSRYDYYDVDDFVQNTRLLKKYLDCFLSKGPCTPIGRLFKRSASVYPVLGRACDMASCVIEGGAYVALSGGEIIPEVIVTGCGKCTPSQKRFARKTFNAFKRHFPEIHAELRQKFDPDNKYYNAFEKAIANA